MQWKEDQKIYPYKWVVFEAIEAQMEDFTDFSNCF